jgi:hypothetical protein
MVALLDDDDEYGKRSGIPDTVTLLCFGCWPCRGYPAKNQTLGDHSNNKRFSLWNLASNGIATAASF